MRNGDSRRLQLQIANKLLPYRDLDIKGDPGRWLILGQDVIFTLTGLIGLNDSEPRLVRIGDNGALLVNEVGGALQNTLTTPFDINDTTVITATAPKGTGAVILFDASGGTAFEVLGPASPTPDEMIITPNVSLYLPISPTSIGAKMSGSEATATGFITFLYSVPFISAAGA